MLIIFVLVQAVLSVLLSSVLALPAPEAAADPQLIPGAHHAVVAADPQLLPGAGAHHVVVAGLAGVLVRAGAVGPVDDWCTAACGGGCRVFNTGHCCQPCCPGANIC